jgi:hypothetical protein
VGFEFFFPEKMFVVFLELFNLGLLVGFEFFFPEKMFVVFL